MDVHGASVAVSKDGMVIGGLWVNSATITLQSKLVAVLLLNRERSSLPVRKETATR